MQKPIYTQELNIDLNFRAPSLIAAKGCSRLDDDSTNAKPRSRSGSKTRKR